MNSSVMQAAQRPSVATLRTVLGLFKLRIGTLIMITWIGLAKSREPPVITIPWTRNHSNAMVVN